MSGVSNALKLSNARLTSLMVFHEPPFANSITDFPSGANTFCVDGQIYQDPNSGPIAGNVPTFLSGNGSSNTHNLPDIYRLGVRFAHPAPKSPKFVFYLILFFGIQIIVYRQCDAQKHHRQSMRHSFQLDPLSQKFFFTNN